MTSDSESQNDKPEAPDGHAATDRVVAAFGGIRPMATKLGTPVTTVQGWKKRGAIPAQRHDAIRTAATEHGIELDDATLTATAPADSSPEPARAKPKPTSRPAKPPPDPPPAAEKPSPPAGSVPKSASRSEAAAKAMPAREMPPTEKGPAPSRPSSGLAWFAVVVALLSVGLVVTAPLWIDSAYRVVGLTVPSGTGPAFDPDRLNALESRLASLERQTEALAARADPDAVAQGLNAELQAIDRRVAAVEDIDPQSLDDRITAVQGAADALAADLARIEGAMGSQRIALTEARAIVTRLEARADEADAAIETLAATQSRDGRRIDRLIASDSATQALVLAIGQLRVAVNAGRPYRQSLSALQALSSGIDETVPHLAALAPSAATGIAGRDSLKSTFPGMAEAVRQAVLLPSDAGWVDRTVARIEGLVTVRPAPGEVDGEDAAAVLARAEGRLNNGDLAGAIAAVAMLEGEAAEAAAAWRRSAEARLAAESALDDLNSYAIARLANAATDPSPQ